MQRNHQIQDDGAGNLKVLFGSFHCYIFCPVKFMGVIQPTEGQLSLNNLRHNVRMLY